MKFLHVIPFAFFLLFAQNAFATEIDDLLSSYKEMATSVYEGACDAGKTTGTVYELDNIPILDTNELASGDFAHRYEELDTGKKHYLWKLAGSLEPLTEVTRKEWYAKMKKASQNFYRATTRLGKHDCHIVAIVK